MHISPQVCVHWPSRWWLEIGLSDSIYTTEVDRCYSQATRSVKHLPARNSPSDQFTYLTLDRRCFQFEFTVFSHINVLFSPAGLLALKARNEIF